MTTTNRTPATAADFVEYVAELRAEGMSDAEIVERYFKTARPNSNITHNHCDGEVVMEWDSKTLWFSDLGDEYSCEAGISIGGAVCETDSLESALAWLANQLAERCPVAAMTDEEFFALPDKRREDMSIRAAEWYERNITHGIHSTRQGRERILDKCRLLRRMFAIAEPGEVGDD